MKILIAPDKFKGSLSARQAAEAIARGFRERWPTAELRLAAITDGGEGFAAALADPKLPAASAQVRDPLGRTITAEYGWMDATTAVMEMSAASGLRLLGGRERDPLRANTFGTGELIADAITRGARKILIGLGGSATTDGGIGVAAALGCQFLTSDGDPIAPIPANLLSLMRIKMPEDFPEGVEIIGACDVENPLLGERGAARVFAPQKGADARAVETLELSLEHLADIVAEDFRSDFRHTPGAGAAGGLGFGLLSFCGAKLRPGFQIVAERLGLESAVAGCDLVLTGEGRTDAQTLMGKGPAGIAALARKHGRPVVAFAGSVENGARGRLAEFFDSVIAIAPDAMPLEESLRRGADLLARAAADAAARLRAGKRLSHAGQSF